MLIYLLLQVDCSESVPDDRVTVATRKAGAAVAVFVDAGDVSVT